MKKLFSLLMILFVSIALFADDKEPVAMNDYAQTVSLQTIAIPVLENDFAYDGHPFKIQIVFGSPNSTFTFNDSVVFYTPKYFFAGVDSLRYRIIDLQNSLMSPIAKIYIEVTNDGITHLDINQVNCKIISNGMQFFDGEYYDGYEAPKGSGLYSIFSKTFWIGGFDQGGELHVAGERYKMTGEDYFQGPVSDTVNYTQDYNIQWHKVWKLTKEEIEYHRANWQQSGYEPVASIRQWPGNGDTQLGQAALLAPFYDWDGDGIYDPFKGDFPLIKGDQAIFLIYNDDRVHSESSGKKLQLEIQAMYYAYDQPDDSALALTIFGSYNIINRSQDDYSNVYAGFFLDFDIGYSWDDYIACDTLLHSAFAFNGSPIDGNGGADTYGDHPPAQSFTCLNYDMDGFMYFNNAWQSPMTDPQTDFEYYNYMQSIWRDSTALTYSGNGYGGTEPTKFAYPGDPVTNDGWTESLSGNLPGDRRCLISSGPLDLANSDTLNLDFALVFARSYDGDHLSSVALLKNRIKEVRDFYQNSLSIEESQPEKMTIKAFPNPFFSQLFIESDQNGDLINWSVFDLLGNLAATGTSGQPAFHLDLRGLNKGIYFLSISNGKLLSTRKIVKM